METTEEVIAAGDRLARAGLQTSVERETACCYALQDKVWVNGAGGEPWEFYTVLADSETDAAGEAACCATRSEPVRLSAKSGSCS